MRCLVLTAGLFIATQAHAEDSFAGTWDTTFGRMTLTVNGDRVSGHYIMDGERCRIDGKVVKRRLTFKYREPSVSGEGWFELTPDGKGFAGRWRQDNTDTWAVWVGKRVATAESTWVNRALASARSVDFSGLWNTSFGRMRLIREGNQVTGIYSHAGGSEIKGTVTGRKLTLRYREPDAQGEAVFELMPDGSGFRGTWKPDGKRGSGSWTGTRVEPKPGVSWLVIVEARWENSLNDDEFSFGAMLRAFFARSSKIQVRHRFFNDEASLKRWCREVAYLAEPAVLVVASHGTENGVSADGRLVPAQTLADSLRYAANLKLLHFSACELMKGRAAESIAQGVPRAIRFPISGYTTCVDWAGSAIIEFAYLDMVLMRNMPPARAAEQLTRLLPFSGKSSVAGSPFGNAGFRLLQPEEVK